MDLQSVAQQLAALSPEELKSRLASLSYEHRVALERLVYRQAWATGDLRYKWHATQLKIDQAVRATDRRKFFLLCSRRTGKTYYLLCRLFEHAIRNPGSRLLYLAPFASDASLIANDLAAKILEDCPDDLKPEFTAQAKEFRFRRPGRADSIVRLKGVNNEHARQLRGGAADEIVIDECALMDNLHNIVTSVCMPMTLTTGGRILLATTPPETPGHDSAKIYEELAGVDAAIKFTIRDTPHVEEEEKARTLLELGEDPDDVPGILAGTQPPKTTAAQREYFCEFVTDASMAVVPEFTKAAQAEVIRETPRPEYFDAYVSMDPGMKDRTGVLFAHYDFVNAKIVIEDELLLDHPGTPDMAAGIRAKETTLWCGGDANREFEPFRRVLDSSGDGGLRLIADLKRGYRLQFSPARKDDSLAAIHLMRQSVASRELVIHPRCKHLIRQLHNAVWNNRATDFARAGERSEDGHYDLVAALKYLIRSVDRSRNPYPAHYRLSGGAMAAPGPRDWLSPKSARRRRGGLGFHADTPLGRRFAKGDKT